MTKCKGCGQLLQTTNEKELGYTNNLESNYCKRCFKIKNYGEYEVVSSDYKEYVNILKSIGKTKDLIVYLIDIINISDKIKDTIKLLNDNILLVITKKDVLPLSLTDEKIYSYIDSLNLNIKDKLVISSKNNYNLDTLYEKINEYKKSDKVYIVGNTNTGKSTLINKLIYNYSDNDSFIVTSMLPSTTLSTLEVKLNDDLTLVDTPGLIDLKNITNYIDVSMLKKVTIDKQIKPITFQVKNYQNIIVEDILKVEIEKGNLTFYLSNKLNIERVFKDKPLPLKKHEISCSNSDIVINGLGFIRVRGNVSFNLYTKEEVEVMIRKSTI